MTFQFWGLADATLLVNVCLILKGYGWDPASKKQWKLASYLILLNNIFRIIFALDVLDFKFRPSRGSMGVTHKIKPPFFKRKYLFESFGSFDELGICLLFDGCENAAGQISSKEFLPR